LGKKAAQSVPAPVNQTPKPVKDAILKKKSKPAWALSKDQKEEVDDFEDDKLLDFMDNLDVEQYISDLEIKNMISTLQKRVSELKEEPDWRDKWNSRLKEKTEKRRQEYIEERQNRDPANASTLGEADNDDVISQTGNLFNRDNMTVASERTHGSLSLISRDY